MPHRTLSPDEAADYLHLSRRDLDSLVKHAEIPYELQGKQVLFRKQQLDAWASQRILGLSDTHLIDFHRKSSVKHHDLSPEHALLPELMSADRIESELASRTKPSILRDMVALAEKTELLCDPVELLKNLEDREALCSTALSGGFALLHPRYHDPYMFMDSFVVMARTTQPIHAGSPDGTPTDLFFLICSQDDRIHLHILARLCTMIRKTPLLEALHEAMDSQEMLDALLKAEDAAIRHI